MPIATVPHYKDIDLKLKVQDFANVQAVPDITCVFMEVNECLMLLRIFLLDKPAM